MAIGNIEKRGKKNYRLTVSGGFDENGKRIWHRKTIEARSEKEAERQLALFISEIERGEVVSTSATSFREFVDMWKTNYAENTLASKTLYRYEGMLKDNILPYIGKMKLEQIKPMHLLNIYSRMAQDGARKDGKEGGYSATTIGHVHRLIHGIMGKAVEWQLIANNPASRVTPPRRTKHEIDFYPQEDAINLMIKLQSADIRHRTMVMLLIYTGIRRSELMALKWNDVDFEKRRILIAKAMVYTPKTGTEVKEAKTTRSHRVIALTDDLAQILEEYRKWQNEARLAMGSLWHESGLVFTRDNGERMHPDSISQWFSKFIERNELPHITLHGLRHTAATLMLQSGVDVETVSRVLGHNNSTVTSMVYLHATQDAKADAMNRLSDQLKIPG